MSPEPTQPRKAEEVGDRLAELCELGDVDGIMALHEPDAVARLEPGTLISG